jgi:hypothetical protein
MTAYTQTPHPYDKWLMSLSLRLGKDKERKKDKESYESKDRHTLGHDEPIVYLMMLCMYVILT